MTADQHVPEAASHAPDRNLALELARVTEAMAAARWVGRGDKNGADGAAVNAMRMLINSVSMRGVVVLGEGEKDQAPMLFNGEEVGDGSGPACDVAVDPIDGTRLCANGMSNAISVFAATGITDGELMAGVRYRAGGATTTHSLVMRSRSGTIRSITSEHQLWKLRAYSSVSYG